MQVARLIITKFRGFSLIESITAFAILSVVLTVTFMCIGWIIQTGFGSLEMKATYVMKEISNETKIRMLYFDEHLERNGFVIEKKILKMPNAAGLYILELQAFDAQNKLTATYEEIISF